MAIGYARVSTTGQDVTAQRYALTALDSAADHGSVDYGLTGTNRDRAWPARGDGLP